MITPPQHPFSFGLASLFSHRGIDWDIFPLRFHSLHFFFICFVHLGSRYHCLFSMPCHVMRCWRSYPYTVLVIVLAFPSEDIKINIQNIALEIVNVLAAGLMMSMSWSFETGKT